MKNILQILALLISISISLPCYAISPYEQGLKHAKPKLVANFNYFQFDHTDKPIAQIGVLFEIEEGWHLYWKNSGDAALPTEIEFTTEDDFSFGELKYPRPEVFIEPGDLTTYGYKNQVLIESDIYVHNPEIFSEDPERTIKISAKIEFLVCNDICVPGKTTIEETFLISNNKPLEPSPYFDLFEKNILISNTKNIKINSSIGKFKQNDYAILEFENLKPEDIQIFPDTSKLEIASIKPFLLKSKTKTTVFFKLDKPQKEKIDLEIALRDDNSFFRTKIVPKSETKQISLNLKESKPLNYLLNIKSDEEYVKGNSKQVNRRHSAFISTYLLSHIFAFIAGIILNFMPCVLPVVAIKLTSLSQKKELSSKAAFVQSLQYTSGVLFSFASLALSVMLLKQGGSALSWGFQFQYPEFVFSLIIITFIFALSFFEYFHISIAKFANPLSKSQSKTKSVFANNFFDGIISTILSTPCTGPFLGTAIAFAFSQNNFTILTIFLAIGLGLSFPYVLLSSAKSLRSFIPKPGTWMLYLKNLMGFFLLCTCAWLLFVLYQLTENGLILSILILSAIFTSLLLTRKFHSKRFSLIVFICLISLILKLWAPLTQKRTTILENQKINHDSLWKPYNESEIESALKNKSSVFIDFTASWCITCKTNKYFVLSSPDIENAFHSNNYQTYVADWTDGNQKVTTALKKYGGTGVPHYVIIKPNSEPKILNTILTKQYLLDLINND